MLFYAQLEAVEGVASKAKHTYCKSVALYGTEGANQGALACHMDIFVNLSEYEYKFVVLLSPNTRSQAHLRRNT